MIRSMTGFGSASGDVDGVAFTVEIRSVNHRYLRVNFKMPDVWSSIESELEKRLRQVMQRGSVDVSLRMKLSDEQAAYRVNTSALSDYIDQLRVLEVEGNPTLRIDLGAMLQLPGVCEPPPVDELRRRTQDGVLELFDKAVAQLVDMRKQEGQALKADLLNHCSVLEMQLDVVIRRAPEVVKDYHGRLKARVQELVDSARINIDAENLAREVAIFAERCDVAEEVSRLRGHLDQFRKATGEVEAAGRKLDFLAQEMLREANTIASKANDSEISQAAVDMKTAIDRIKEQVQNVE